MKTFRYMQGVYVVEFALIGAVLLVLLIGVLDLGRLYFTVNALAEVSRRGARLAAVCDIRDSHILHRALFNEAGDGGVSSLITNLHVDSLKIDYFDGRGAFVGAPEDLESVDGFRAIRFVQLRVENFPFSFLIPLQLLVPGFDGSITLPTFQSTLPRESLGRHPDEGVSPEITPC